jgi:phosphotransacetylase
MNNLPYAIPPGTNPLKTAVISPIDSNSLSGAIVAASEGLISPLLVGDTARIEEIAKTENLSLEHCELIHAETPKKAAVLGVEEVKNGRAEALMKGLVPTQTFLAPIVAKDANLRTSRRMSHVFCLSDPDYPKPLYVSDCAVNNMRGVNLNSIEDADHNQDLLKNVSIKKDIIQNAIDFFLTIEGHTPKVALLSATEKVSAKFPCSIEAKKLVEMAQKGEITGGHIDGPFALDIAISKQAALIKGVSSDVAGDADILILPNLVSGNIFYKGLTKLSDTKRGGVVLGAKVPIILTSRMADIDTRLMSSALALLSMRSAKKVA